MTIVWHLSTARESIRRRPLSYSSRSTLMTHADRSSSADSTLILELWIIWTVWTVLQIAPQARTALSGSFHPWCFFSQLVYLSISLRPFARFQSSCSNQPTPPPKKNSDLRESSEVRKYGNLYWYGKITSLQKAFGFHLQINLKAAICKFCLFVAISVWKSAIAAICVIIFLA